MAKKIVVTSPIKLKANKKKKLKLPTSTKKKLGKKVGDKLKKRKKGKGISQEKARLLLKKNKDAIVITINEDDADYQCFFFEEWTEARAYIKKSVSEEHYDMLSKDRCVATYVDLLDDDCEFNKDAVHIKANMGFYRFLGDEFLSPNRRIVKPSGGRKKAKLGLKDHSGKKTIPVGDVIKLTDLVENTFEARRVLRQARDSGKLVHTNSRWEWEKNDPTLKQVKELLGS